MNGFADFGGGLFGGLGSGMQSGQNMWLKRLQMQMLLDQYRQDQAARAGLGSLAFGGDPSGQPQTGAPAGGQPMLSPNRQLLGPTPQPQGPMQTPMGTMQAALQRGRTGIPGLDVPFGGGGGDFVGAGGGSAGGPRFPMPPQASGQDPRLTQAPLPPRRNVPYGDVPLPPPRPQSFPTPGARPMPMEPGSTHERMPPVPTAPGSYSGPMPLGLNDQRFWQFPNAAPQGGSVRAPLQPGFQSGEGVLGPGAGFPDERFQGRGGPLGRLPGGGFGGPDVGGQGGQRFLPFGRPQALPPFRPSQQALPTALGGPQPRPSLRYGSQGDILGGGPPLGKLPVDYIPRGESGWRNIPNYRYDPTHTAQGYFQITNTTWNEIAPKVEGAGQYRNAMAAPFAVQRAVAQELYNQRGFQPWSESMPAIKKALAGAKDPDMKMLVNSINPSQPHGQAFTNQLTQQGLADVRTMLRAVLEANPGLRNHPEVLWRAVELLNPILNSESKNEISMMRQENQTLRDQMQTEAKQRQLEEKRREFDKTFTQKQQFHDDTIAEHARKAAALADKVRGESDLKMRKFYLEQYKAELKAADTESMIKRREEMTKLGYSDQDIKRDYHQHQYSNWAQERAESEQRLDIARQNMTTAKDKSEWERQKADYDAYKNELAARQRELEDLIKESGVIGIDPKVRDEYLRQADDIRKKLAEDPPVMPQFGAPTGPSVPPAATRPTPPTAKPSGITDEESAWAKSKLADKSASAEEIKSILRARHPGMSDQDLEAAISGQPGR